MSIDGLSVEEVEIAYALQQVRKRFNVGKDKLTLALGREPTAAELLEVMPHHVEVLHRLSDMVDPRRKHVNCVPNSLLTQIHVRNFLTKVQGHV